MPIMVKVGNTYKEATAIYDKNNHEIDAVYAQNGNPVYFAWKNQTLTGIPPLSFRANGKPLISWSMLGNGQQTGTPTPDAPIIPEFVGVRTANLAYGRIETVNITSTGLIVRTAGYDVALARVESGVIYTANSYVIAFYTDEPETGSVSYNGSRIVAIQGQPTTFTAPITGYAAFRLATGENAMLNTGTTALPYEPYGYKIHITNAGQTVPVYLGQTRTTRRIGKLILTGEETIVGSTLSGGWIVTNLPVNMVNTTGFITAICTHYKAVSNAAMTSLTAGDMCISTNSTNRINFATNISTAADFKAYLAAQYAAGTPVTVWYVLETPETAIVNEPLCKIGDYADELHSEDAGVTIPTVKGENVLTVDTVLRPSSAKITYYGRPVNSI